MPELFKYSYRVLKYDLTPGLTDFEIVLDGEKVVYASPTNGPEVSLRLQLKSNDAIPLRPQGEIVAPFQRLYLSSPAVAATIFLLIGSPKDIQLTGRDISISGTVGQKDLYERALFDGQLYRFGNIRGPVAATFTATQVFNPVGSGKTVMVLEAILSHAVNMETRYEITTTALAALMGNLENMNMGSPDSVAQIRSENLAAPFTGGGSAILHTIIPASTPFVFRAMALLSPGEGVVQIDTVVNVQQVFGFAIWEF